MNRGRRRSTACAFSLVEMLIALAISAVLLVATLAALQVSFDSYRINSDQASTHAIGRMVVQRMTTMIRSGEAFRPLPPDVRDRVVTSDFIEFYHPDTDNLITVTWDRIGGRLEYRMDNGVPVTLLEGVVTRTDEAGRVVQPFRLEWEPGRRVYRVTIDLMIIPDDSISTPAGADPARLGAGSGIRPIRLVASAMPRSAMF